MRSCVASFEGLHMPKSINKIAKNRKPSQTEKRVGDICPLSLETPYGLFEEIVSVVRTFGATRVVD